MRKDEKMIINIKKALKKYYFWIKELVLLKFSLGVKVTCSKVEIYICRGKYLSYM